MYVNELRIRVRVNDERARRKGGGLHENAE